MPKLRGKRSISLISAVNNQLSLSDSVIFLRVSPKNVKNHFFYDEKSNVFPSNNFDLSL